MSLSAIATLRPLHGRCFRHAATGLLSLHLRSGSSKLRLQAVVSIRPQQKRQQSSVSRVEPSKPEQPKMTFFLFLRRLLGGSLRNMAVALSPRGIRSALRDSPASTSISLILLILTLAAAVVAVRAYMKTFYNAQFSRYPEPIANTLRRAIYYTNIKPEPELALKYYKKAMEQCAELGLDPFSDEVLGIRVQVSFWLQKINSHKSAIDVLESVLKDLKKWVEVMEQSVKDGKVDAKGYYVTDAPPSPPNSRGGGAGGAEAEAKTEATMKVAAKSEVQDSEVQAETLWRKRQRLLAKAIGTGVKLGELYADEHILDGDKSHAHLVWAVETSLKEFKRRSTDGIKPGEEAWLTPEELGSSMESLGRDYERRSQFQLAIPLFFQALRLCQSPCHRAVIMNNLAAAFAQHPIYSPTQADGSDTLKEVFDSAMPTTRKDCLDAAATWASNAFMHAQDVKGEERTPECDEACAVALCNWGDAAAMLGKTELARKKYKECIEMSRKMEFPDGVRQAQAGLARLA
ncbi:TPR Domain containing protein [Drechmeria coniospora]|uniref:TPR Domain containing protein n=1 Tax=Drechmeria coniospora TaxID=98403 RepID=A0A151GT87_DRECN|nr:TPR Domain containing protein [Drechmeria coniospora]KYK60273.1 TPR Domain containing protein [Drechmeria coniospora]